MISQLSINIFFLGSSENRHQFSFPGYYHKNYINIFLAVIGDNININNNNINVYRQQRNNKLSMMNYNKLLSSSGVVPKDSYIVLLPSSVVYNIDKTK